ncbi:hypothetical protein NE237_002013 [Protea cynaroides]|uniref:Uncharacterized protein n=1 Tax=Protea cynaroides TaxID=273540 RepID=A0A9Q0KUG0_9MAGN|nr:hypothetical protein NE237_002013 [Protea cynaroides]
MEAQVLHMNAGEGEASYANNSQVQKLVIAKAKPIVAESIVNLCSTTLPQCLRVADLGCSSGPNSLIVISDIIDTVEKTCRRLNRSAPEFQIFLNDLPGNDFNTIFKFLPAFYERLKKEKGEEFGPCFVFGLPGSFYERLFPSDTMDFIHSSYSLHWLSQVPQGLEDNKGNVYVSKTSPSSVYKAYLKQFQRDFSKFLSTRSKEVRTGGHMVITIAGRRSKEPYSEDSIPWELLALSLNDLVSQGVIEEKKLDSFNMNIYHPCTEEVEAIIKAEGSFNLDKLDTYEVVWEAIHNGENKELMLKESRSSKIIAMAIRAVTEPLLVHHFGEAINIDKLFQRYEEHASEFLSKEKGCNFNIVISMKKK